MIRVLHVGLGPIGAAVARQIDSRKGFRIVGAIDIDSKKIGQDVGIIIGAPRTLRVKVGVDIGKTIKAAKPDIAVVCTSSSLKGVLPELLEVIKHRVPVVTTTEEAVYPQKANLDLAKRIDDAAKKAEVAVLGTGVNPGFTMDALPIALSAVSTCGGALNSGHPTNGPVGGASGVSSSQMARSAPRTSGAMLAYIGPKS